MNCARDFIDIRQHEESFMFSHIDPALLVGLLTLVGSFFSACISIAAVFWRLSIRETKKEALYENRLKVAEAEAAQSMQLLKKLVPVVQQLLILSLMKDGPVDQDKLKELLTLTIS